MIIFTENAKVKVENLMYSCNIICLQTFPTLTFVDSSV